ncbi:MAG: Tad domain-containing protein [Deltaproteobacteria bacterium]|nr:MAG: Tad domain-containing protein [Deltaproteobacteria bacterium]
MLKIFTRQIQRLGKDEGGQSIVFVAIVLIVLVCFLAVTINVGSQVSRKIRLQNAADAAALSGATWEARGLNIIAELNEGIMGTILVMIAYVVLTGVLWFVPGLQGTAATLTCNAPNQLNRFYNVACRLAYLEKKIANFFPVVAEFEVLRIANANGVRIVALPFPIIPVSYKKVDEKKMNLGYHVAEADMSELMRDVASKIWQLLNDITGNALEKANEVTKWFGLDLEEIVTSSAEAAGKAFDFSGGGMNFAPEKKYVFGKERYSEIGKLMARENPFENVTEIKSKKWRYDVQIFRPSSCSQSGCPTNGSQKKTCEIKKSYSFPYSVPPPNSWFLFGFSCSDVMTRGTQIVKDLKAGKQILDETYEVYDECSYSTNSGSKKCSYMREKWEFVSLEVKVVEEYDAERTDALKLTPLKLDSDFFDKQWLAVAAWDTLESSKPTILPRLLSNTNVWGSLAFAQAKPTSGDNEADKVILYSDWEARLTPFTAIEDIAGGAGGSGKVKGTFEKIGENIILH